MSKKESKFYNFDVPYGTPEHEALLFPCKGKFVVLRNGLFTRYVCLQEAYDTLVDEGYTLT